MAGGLTGTVRNERPAARQRRAIGPARSPIHLLPAAAILAALAIGWRWEWAGGLLLVAFAVAYPVLTGGNVGWQAVPMISGPPLVAGILFLAG